MSDSFLRGVYGECIIIYHGDGISSLYAHCDNGTRSRPTFEVKVGDTVRIYYGGEIMETYPARFDRKAERIEVLRENITFEKSEVALVRLRVEF